MCEKGVTQTVIWVEKPADIEIRDGIARCSIESGGVRVEITTTPAVLLESIRRGTGAYNEFVRDERSAQIVKLSRRGPMFLAERHD